MWVMNADSKACDAGALPRSEMPFSSQKQCHISSPVPYVARVSSSHACTMVSFTRSCSFVLAVALLGGTGCVLAGTHILSRSLARQCGHSMEGIGVRFCGYGAGLLGTALEVGGMGRLLLDVLPPARGNSTVAGAADSLHSNAGAVKRPFAPHEQSPAVARLATVRTTASLEGPLRVGPTNFWKSPLRGLYVFVRIVLRYSTLFYDLQIRNFFFFFGECFA